jgi:hypothetical protein
LQLLIQIIRRPATRISGLPLGISGDGQRAKHCRYNSYEGKVFGEQHPIIMQAFDAMDNPISLMRFTCAPISARRLRFFYGPSERSA